MPETMNRRTLLRTGALAAGASALPGSLLALPPSPIRLGVASYTFRAFPRAQVIGFLKQLSVHDLNCKDVKDHLPTDPAQEAAAVADYKANGIKLHACGSVYFTKDDDDDIRAKFEYAKRAGIPVIVAGDPSPESLPRVEKFVKEYDIKIAIHNHGPEDKLWQSPLDILKLIKNMDPRIGCCIDVGHTERAGTDPVEAIHKVGARLFNMHIKDLTDLKVKESQVAVGEGKIPIPDVFKALVEIKYKGFVDLEYEIKENDPMPGVTSSFAYMRKVIAEMGYQA
jgi:sugar phosphate isomerase/epimerase